MFLALGAGWLLGKALRLTWASRRAWQWLPPLWVGLFGLGPTAPGLLRLALAALGVVLLVRAVRALPGLVGGRGVSKPGNGQRAMLAEAEAARWKAAKGARLERVSWGAEPPPRVWPVMALVPQGPRPRWRLRLHPIPLERETRGYVTTVIGSGGTGKSYLLVDLALALLTGGLWLGQRVLPLRSVLYVDAELDVDTMRERAWQVARGRGLSRPPGPSRWWQLPRAWLRPYGLHYLALPVSLATEEGLALVAARARGCRAELILFDSLTIGSAGAGLADQNAWNRVLSGMEAWGVPSVVIDHMGKSEGRGAVGSFMKQAKVRSAVELERQKDGTITVEHAKSNFGPMLPEWRIRPVFQHTDAADAAAGVVRFDVVTSEGVPVVADPDGAGTAGRPATGGLKVPPAPTWGKREQVVLEAFAARGGAGATVPAVAADLAPRLGARAYKSVGEAVRKLAAGGALLEVEKVTAPGRPPAARYVVPGAAPAEDVAVAQAEALLRDALGEER